MDRVADGELLEDAVTGCSHHKRELKIFFSFSFVNVCRKGPGLQWDSFSNRFKTVQWCQRKTFI